MSLRSRQIKSVLWLLLALWLLAVSSARSAEPRNFVHDDRELLQAAESARQRSAKFWSGQPLAGDWFSPCPIVWETRSGNGSGLTRFQFGQGDVYGWEMRLHGSRESVLADVLPHEVDHAVRATLVRRPLPRWLDEGCSSVMESADLHEQLRTMQKVDPRRLRVSDLDRMDYPQRAGDNLALYAAGFSLVEYLLEKGTPADLLAVQRSTSPPSRALATVYKQPVDELLKDWEQWESQRLARGCRCALLGCPCQPRSTRPTPALPLAFDSRPELTVWSSPACGPCRQFVADLNGPLKSLTEEFRVVVYDYQGDRPRAVQAGIVEVPTFVLGEIRVIGYRGPEQLLAELGLAESSIPVKPVPNNPRPRPPTLVDERAVPVPVAPEVDPRPAPALPKPVEAIIEQLPSKAAEAAPGASGSGWWQWGLSGWQLALAIAAAAGTGGLLTPAVIWPAVRFGWRTITGLRRLRKSRSERATTDSEQPGGEVRGHAPFPRHLDEARELLRLRQQEGRVAALDAIRGMALDDAAQIILDSPQTTEAEKVAVRKLMTQIDQHVDEIAPISTRGG